ncbi:MAG TPA: endonuclease domain-containing protein [Alphaproteobacteria bacterium]|nr:endonuclease domain-containing protein [Alphaproteobacteria bacterium]
MRHAPTDAEKLLWARLRSRGFAGHKFRRQRPIGPYVADFACLAGRLVVEIDGGQHAAASAKELRRTVFLEKQGFRILRFWNHEVLGNIEGVLAAISCALEMPSPRPSPACGRGRHELA